MIEFENMPLGLSAAASDLKQIRRHSAGSKASLAVSFPPGLFQAKTEFFQVKSFKPFPRGTKAPRFGWRLLQRYLII